LDHHGLRHCDGERGKSLRARAVENGSVVYVKAVEEEGTQRNALPQPFDIELTAKPVAPRAQGFVGMRRDGSGLRRALIGRKSGSHETPRWREQDSNA